MNSPAYDALASHATTPALGFELGRLSALTVVDLLNEATGFDRLALADAIVRYGIRRLARGTAPVRREPATPAVAAVARAQAPDDGIAADVAARLATVIFPSQAAALADILRPITPGASPCGSAMCHKSGGAS